MVCRGDIVVLKRARDQSEVLTYSSKKYPLFLWSSESPI